MYRNTKLFLLSAALTVLILNGCSAENTSEMPDNELPVSESEEITTETEETTVTSETTVTDITTETSEAPITIVRKTSISNTSGLEKNNSAVFYGFSSEPYTAKGTGPEKPENYNPADYYIFCDDAEITDPELKDMIDSFAEESKKSIEQDFKRFASYHNLEASQWISGFEIDKIAQFTTDIKIVNNYCIVHCYYEFLSGRAVFSDLNKKFESKTTYFPLAHRNFGSRCAYFEISGRKRLELSDLFFKDYDFTTEINREMERKMDSFGSTVSFKGLSEEFMQVFTEEGYLHYIAYPLLTPYPVMSDIDSNQNHLTLYDCIDMMFNSCIYSSPVRYDTDVYTGITKIGDLTVYGSSKTYPEIVSCPIRSSLFDDESLDELCKNVTDNLNECVYNEPMPSQSPVRCPVYIKYLNDMDLFYGYIAHDKQCQLSGHQNFCYDKQTLKEMSLSEVLAKAIGENWQDYFETNLDGLTLNNLTINTYPPVDSFTLERNFGIITDKQIRESINVTYSLEDNKWVAVSYIKEDLS